MSDFDWPDPVQQADNRAITNAASGTIPHTGTPMGLHPLRSCDAVRYGPTGHPIDPTVCVNALGTDCGPEDCVLDHMMRVLGPGDRCPCCGTDVPMQTEDGYAPVDNCRSCMAPIVWAETGAGQSMPVNAKLDPAGNVTIGTRDGRIVAEVLTQDSLFETDAGGGYPRHTAHFVDCPHAGQWRRAK